MVSYPIPRAGSSRDGARTRHQRGMPRAAGDRIGDARLLQRLARPRPLTILRAPSGFGKSSIVAQWLRATVADTADVVWLGADVGGWGGDDAPDTFWRALASRLDELEPGEEARRWGDAREAVTDMLSRRKDPVYVVLDRYSQMVPGRSEVDRALTELLHTCENFFLIVCTREVSSLEVVGAAIVDSLVLRPTDLALTPGDVVALAARHDLTLSESEASAICAHTGGWPALVRVILVSSAAERQGGDRATIRFDAGTWFLRTAWQEFDLPGLQEFVMDTSVFPSLTESLLEELMPDRDCASYLDALLAAGLMQIDHVGGEQVYRHLPAVRLEAATRLREQDVERYQQLCLLAARRHEAVGDHGGALAQLVTAGLWPEVLSLAERRWTALVSNDEKTLERVLPAIPDDVVMQSAHLVAARDYVLEPVDDDARPWHHEHPLGGVLGPMLGLITAGAETTEINGRPRGYDAFTETVRRALPGVLCEWGVSRVLAVDLPGALRSFRDAHQVAELAALAGMQRRAALGAAMVQCLNGDIRDAQAWLRRHDEAAAVDHEVVTPLLGQVADGVREIVRVSALEASDAARILDLPLDRSFGGLWAIGLLAKTQVALMTGQVAGLLDELDDAARVVANDVDARLLGSLVACARVDLLLALGQHLRARAVVDRLSGPLQSVEVARARVAWLTGNHGLAVDTCTRLLRADVPTPRIRISLLGVQAAAEHARGRQAEAVRVLHLLAHEVNATRLFSALLYVPRSMLVELGPEVPALGEALAASGVLDVDREVFPAPSTQAELSERELEVLAALARTGSVNGVATSLYVTSNTVKTHLRSIYRKLGTHSARETVQRAVEFGLIDEVVSARLSV